MGKRINQKYFDLLNGVKDLFGMVCGQSKADYLQLLAAAQEYVIILGNSLEERKVSEEVIHVLEDIAELIYQMAYVQTNEEEQKSTAQSIISRLQQVKAMLNRELDLRYEVVFLPYKASMWDSLDSIYRAVKEDKSYHAVVMPIPYSNITSQGEILKTYYEGDEFPKDIEITDYREYDLGIHMPDLIFIHNPYDQYNLVTRVPPEFYSSILVHYTDHLVYIPYYIMNGSQINEDFVKMPGIFNSWRTFVQSEDIKDKYIEYHKGDKIVALGSPKIDAVINTKIENVCLPEKWGNIVEGKKVFLLNTHLTNILNHANALFQKLSDILCYFEKNSNAVLWWRPHPLSQQAARSLRPEILEQYNSLLEKALSIPNVIYDNTSDLNRAIFVADAYLGDEGSSIVELFGITGKPLWFFDSDLEKREIGRNIMTTYSAVKVEKNIYFFENRYNALFCIDLVQGTSEQIGFSPEEFRSGPSLYTAVQVVKDKLYFVPCSAKGMYVYDLRQGRGEVVSWPRSNYIQQYNPVVVEKYLWLMPVYSGDEIIRINTENNEIYQVECIYDAEVPNVILKSDDAVFYSAVLYNRKIWRACRTCSSICSFDLDSHKVCFYQLPDRKNGYRELTFDGTDFWLISQTESEIVKWNPDTQESKVISTGLMEETVFPAFNSLEYYNGFIWLIPYKGSVFLQLDTKSQDITKHDFSNPGLKTSRDFCLWCRVQFEGRHMYLYPNSCNQLVIADLETGSFETIVTTGLCGWTEEEITDYIMMERNENGWHNKSGTLFFEERICKLNSFVDRVLAGTLKRSEEVQDYYGCNTLNYDGTAGSKIWANIKKSMEDEEREMDESGTRI